MPRAIGNLDNFVATEHLRAKIKASTNNNNKQRIQREEKRESTRPEIPYHRTGAGIQTQGNEDYSWSEYEADIRTPYEQEIPRYTKEQPKPGVGNIQIRQESQETRIRKAEIEAAIRSNPKKAFQSSIDIHA